MRALSRPSSVLVHALLQVFGVGVVGAGAWMAWPPAGLIAWGVGIVALSVAAELSS